MNQQATGRFIAQRRRGLNLTQEQLAERLNVSNKTVSKWENGRCLPDYRVVGDLCAALGVSVSELMDGGRSSRAASAPTTTPRSWSSCGRCRACSGRRRLSTASCSSSWASR